MKIKDIKADAKTLYAIGSPNQMYSRPDPGVVIGFGWKKQRFRDFRWNSLLVEGGKGVAIAKLERDWNSDDEHAKVWKPYVVPASSILRTWEEQKILEKEEAHRREEADKRRQYLQEGRQAKEKSLAADLGRLGLWDVITILETDAVRRYPVKDMEELVRLALVGKEKER